MVVLGCIRTKILISYDYNKGVDVAENECKSPLQKHIRKIYRAIIRSTVPNVAQERVAKTKIQIRSATSELSSKKIASRIIVIPETNIIKFC